MKVLKHRSLSTNQQKHPVASEPFFRAAQIFPKLSINAPGDRYEQEADAMADRVMRMSVDASAPTGKEEEELQTKPLGIQRKCAACEEEESMHRKETDSTATLPLMRKAAGGGYTASPALASRLHASRGNGQALPKRTLATMNQVFATDFSQVRVHHGPEAAGLNREIGARAFTYGSDIYFNKGEFQPDSSEGKYLLAHELTHVQQQAGGIRRLQLLRARRLNPNLVEVEHENVIYRVHRRFRIRDRSARGRTRSSVTGDINPTNVTVTLNVCRNRTRGEVTLGANLPERARQVASQLIQAATQGSRDDVINTLRGVDLTPFIEVVLAQSGRFQITARGEITVGLEGVTGGGGSLGVEAGPVRAEVRGEADENGWRIMGGITLRPGAGTATFECADVPVTYDLVCQTWQPATRTPIPIQVPYHDRQVRYLYFNYSQAIIDRSRSGENIRQITELLGQGYRVSSVEGYTSPEGPRGPGRRFEGNEELARNRAGAALTEIRAICGRMELSMRSSARCAEGASTLVEPLGRGELYSAPDEGGQEARGRRLAEHAVEQFREESAEVPHRSEELLRSLEGKTPQQQADIIYPLLRRAVVVLEKSGTREQTNFVEEEAGYRDTPCPPLVENQARLQFNL